ncbi:DUF418 domain-containing protein [Metabacillus litoralis]|uniref:DUF418 domain-containing protein n=1 Tax=Metabacillus litoralis TaxID=152268 RepID=UPI001CFEB7E3|nr:DUF418 domain-containing protein [Metabacillus litoralis]
MDSSLPVLGKDRIITIDIIRGFALFGIFLVNMPAFHSSEFLGMIYSVEHAHTEADYWMDFFFSLFIDMKFFTIFSFLFGLGFYIFMSRAEEKGLKMKRLFARRMVALLVIGLLHLVLLWFGDILHTYAITGFLLLLFYKRKIKTMIIWAISLLVVYNLMMSISLIVPDSILDEINKESMLVYEEKIDEYVEAYESAGYVEWVSYRIQTEVIPVLSNLIVNMIPILAMFLFGLAAGKAGVFKPNTSYQSLIRKVSLIMAFVSIPLLVLLALAKLEILGKGFKNVIYVELFTSLSGVTLCFFYISTLTLLLRKQQWQKRLRPLGYAGQMALTNYLSQSIICMGIFVLGGLYNQISLLTGTVICVTIFALQMLVSYYWLKTYQFGPIEWLWRSFTYGKLQRIKKKKLRIDNVS